METAELLLSLILTVSFVLRVTDGQGEVTERVCVSYCIVIIYYRCYQIKHYYEHDSTNYSLVTVVVSITVW